jgi:hypothetical protein
LQQVFVTPAQFFGIGVGLGPGLAVVGNGFGLQIIHGGIGYQRGVKAFGLAALVEDGQVVVGAMLVGAADAPQRTFGQALGLEEDGFVLGLRLGHMHHQHRFGLLKHAAGNVTVNFGVEDVARDQYRVHRMGIDLDQQPVDQRWMLCR